jgi:hypothetical protein
MEFQILKKLSLYVAVLLLTACRKDVTLELPEYQQKVVVEGSIEPGLPAIVLLSYGVPYFGDFDYSTPEKTFIKGAKVVVTDGIKIDTLRELDPRTGYLYVGSQLFGKFGVNYTLRVIVDGKTYETETTIMQPPTLDSLYFKTDHDSLGFIWQRFSEPAGIGDSYRWFAKRMYHDDFFAAPFNSVFNDKFVDGKAFDFGYNRGAQPNATQQNREDPERGYFKQGDTVIVKFCRIGQREYDFWHSYYQNKASNANPFSAPVNIKSMFENYEEVFGAFVGYAPYIDTLIIPTQ